MRSIADLEEYKTKPVRSSLRLVDTIVKDGKRIVSGNKNLKASQAYPLGFGQATHNIYMDHKNDIMAHGNALQKKIEKVELVPADVFCATDSDSREWKLAAFDEVLKFLTK